MIEPMADSHLLRKMAGKTDKYIDTDTKPNRKSAMRQFPVGRFLTAPQHRISRLIFTQIIATGLYHKKSHTNTHSSTQLTTQLIFYTVTFLNIVYVRHSY